MRVLLSTWGSRGDVEPLLGLAVQLQKLGAAVRVCAPPDFAESVARVGAEMVAAGQSVRALVHGKDGRKPSTPADGPHDGPVPTVESLSAALEIALAPETRSRATAVASLMRTDGAAVAAQLLIDAITNGRCAV